MALQSSFTLVQQQLSNEIRIEKPISKIHFGIRPYLTATPAQTIGYRADDLTITLDLVNRQGKVENLITNTRLLDVHRLAKDEDKGYGVLDDQVQTLNPVYSLTCDVAPGEANAYLDSNRYFSLFVRGPVRPLVSVDVFVYIEVAENTSTLYWKYDPFGFEASPVLRTQEQDISNYTQLLWSYFNLNEDGTTTAVNWSQLRLSNNRNEEIIDGPNLVDLLNRLKNRDEIVFISPNGLRILTEATDIMPAQFRRAVHDVVDWDMLYFTSSTASIWYGSRIIRVDPVSIDSQNASRLIAPMDLVIPPVPVQVIGRENPQLS